jgi:NitT/TauT family transport system substrate-binding protein
MRIAPHSRAAARTGLAPVIARHVAALLLAAVVLGCQPATSSGTSGAGAAGGAAGAPAPTVSAPAPASTPAPSPAASARARLAPPVRVTVADNLTASGVGLFMAMEQGYFTAEGLDVTLEQVGNSSDAFPQLAAGRYDVVGSAAGPTLFNAVQRGVGLKVVADESSIPPQFRSNSGLVVARTSFESGRFPSVASLRGANLGVAALGSAAEFGLRRTLNAHGIGRDDVQITTIPFPDINAALVNGAVDGGWQAEPFMTLGLVQGMLHRLVGSEDPSGITHAAAVIVYGEEFIARKPAAADRFMIAYLRGIRDNYEAFFGGGRGRDAVIASLTKYTPVKDTAIYEQMAVHHQNPDGYVSLAGFQQIAEWSVTSGYTQQPVDTSRLIDHGYVERALAVLGPYAAAPPPGP